jgi:hypothetical protein
MINARLLAAATLLVAATAIAPAAVSAKSDDVVRTGSCSGSADWKLKAGKDDGRIEVEFEVDSNHNGQVWRVKLRDNGDLRLRANYTTHGPSGSFSVERRIANLAGSDHIVAKARNLASGQVCMGSVTV